ncbi:hypothetical protein Tco_0642989 [Tanacetum coccineum]
MFNNMNKIAIIEEDTIDSGFARFNAIITSLKALDESFSSKKYVRKFLRALHLKWRPKVVTIKESKDLSSLSREELIGNLKVYEMVMEKYFEILRVRKTNTSLKCSLRENEVEKTKLQPREVKTRNTPWSPTDPLPDPSKRDPPSLGKGSAASADRMGQNLVTPLN